MARNNTCIFKKDIVELSAEKARYEELHSHQLMDIWPESTSQVL